MLRLIKKVMIATVVLFLLPISVFASETYTIDPMHTYVLWHISHFGYSVQVGKFTMIEGQITVDDKKPEKSIVNVTIPMNNIVTGIPKLDEHLSSPDFFNVQKYPTATFKSDKVVVTGKNKGKVYGTLTLLGVSKPVVLDVVLLKEGVHPMKNVKSLGFAATTTIKRSDFGISKYVPALGDEVQIDIGSEADLKN